MGAKLALSYNENRRGALLSLVGSAKIYISTVKTDVESGSPNGICIVPDGNFLLTWILHQELCWQEWWATCSSDRLTIWEIFDTPAFPNECLTPITTKCKPWIDPNTPQEPKLPERCRIKRAEPCRRLKAYIDRLKGNYNAQGETNFVQPTESYPWQ